MSDTGGRGRGRHPGRNAYGRGRGRGGDRGPFALRAFARNLRQAETGFQTVSDKAAKPPEGRVSENPDLYKESIANKCSLKFSSALKDEEVGNWYRNYRKQWPAPNGGFKGANVVVFWDIENCRPDPDYAPLPINYAEMLRDAFKATTDARSFRCIASLSKSYPASKPGAPKRPGDAKLGYDQLTALNGQAGYMFILTAPGKTNERVHKDVREADDQLKCKMNAFLSECSAGDVAVVISGDQGYVPFCLQAKEKGVNVIVMGPALAGTSGHLLAAADLWMDWPTFAAFQGREQRRVPAQMSRTVHEATERIRRSHEEQYSCVKELDLVILLDTTHSMAPYIQGVRDNIGRVLDQISLRFPWAKQHMRVGCVGYRDFMEFSDLAVLERDQFQVCPLASADRLREFLGRVQALRGADSAEDVVGGLMQVATMLRKEQLTDPGAGKRNCVLFHICDMPQHGREFNNFTNDKNDNYLNGPLNPTGKAVPPPGRVRPWMEEAEEVLRKLKNELNVSKYALLQIQPKYTTKMAAAFRRLVGDPEEVGEESWSWKKAREAEVAGGGGGDVATEPWISTLEMPAADVPNGSGSAAEQATSISSSLVRMMVSTTLVTITRLSQLIYDNKRGLTRQKIRAKGNSVALQTLSEMDEVGEDLGEIAHDAVDAINSGAMELARTADDEEPQQQQQPQTPAAVKSGAGAAGGGGSPEKPASPASPAGPGAGPGAGGGGGAGAPRPLRFDNSTNYAASDLEKKRNRIISRIKSRMAGGSVDAEEVMLDEPADLDELVYNILDGERFQRKMDARTTRELPQLLQVNKSPVPVKYYRSLTVTAEGAQRLVYEAVRLRKESATKTVQELVVMKEFKQAFTFGNSVFRYIQMCQGNVVASYLAQLFNATCAESGIAEVEGRPRADLVYMPMWTASWTVEDVKKGSLRCNHHVEPYILGKYIKYNSNAGAVNMATLDSICHTFSHWTYAATRGVLMVTDVQGVKDHRERKILLTDPAVHCVPLVSGYFDAESNRGPYGVKEFFLSHVCNDACKKLGLQSADVELQQLRAKALAGELPGRCGTVLDLDAEM